MHINEEIVMKPGMTRVNIFVLDYPYELSVAKKELKELLAQISENWDHIKD
jgi:hypothetical protein